MFIVNMLLLAFKWMYHALFLLWRLLSKCII